MNKHQKREANREKNVFAFENKEFICRYELIAQKAMTRTRLMKELSLTRGQFQSLEKKYLQFFYGKQ